MTNFNPRAPCGARRPAAHDLRPRPGISTHAPLAGRDHSRMAALRLIAAFQPTRPLRGATALGGGQAAGRVYFNPRAPCGARPVPDLHRPAPRYFNPRAPCGARRPAAHDLRPRPGISTHAPLAGRDDTDRCESGAEKDFNPRAPCGARPELILWVMLPSDFNPRAPCGARPSAGERTHGENISTHAPLAGRDL